MDMKKRRFLSYLSMCGVWKVEDEMKKSAVLFMMLGLAIPAMNIYASTADADQEVFEANGSGFEFTIPEAFKAAKGTLVYDDLGNYYSTDEGVLDMACTYYPMSEEGYDDQLDKEGKAEDEGILPLPWRSLIR